MCVCKCSCASACASVFLSEPFLSQQRAKGQHVQRNRLVNTAVRRTKRSRALSGIYLCCLRNRRTRPRQHNQARCNRYRSNSRYLGLKTRHTSGKGGGIAFYITYPIYECVRPANDDLERLWFTAIDYLKHYFCRRTGNTMADSYRQPGTF